jgi:uncharacterized protein HemX
MAFWRSRPWAFGVLLLAVLAAVGALLSWQKINHVQEELARRSTDTGTQAMEARTLARQSQEATRELSARLLATETRLNEVSLQRTQLEELMRSLSRSRDDNLVIDLEAGLRLAQQQALLTGSAEPLLAALKSAELRLVRAAQPRLSPVQRAMGQVQVHGAAAVRRVIDRLQDGSHRLKLDDGSQLQVGVTVDRARRRARLLRRSRASDRTAA